MILERIFSNEVKEFVSEYSNKKSDKKVQEEQQEDTYIEEEEWGEDGTINEKVRIIISEKRLRCFKSIFR